MTAAGRDQDRPDRPGRPALLAARGSHSHDDDIGDGQGPPWLGPLAALDQTEQVDLEAAFALARDWGSEAPHPGAGHTGDLWSRLATLASLDLTAVRVVEPHLDALAIFAQCPVAPELERVGAGPDSVWGVYAAEGPGVRVDAEQLDGGAWVLTGTKPWCSLASRVSHAVVTARTPGGRRAFAVDLADPGIRVLDAPWVSRGLVDVPSGPISLDRVPAVPVGDDEWYLTRAGFAWGGVGVAACWFGGAVGVARTLRDNATRREPDQVSLVHLGAVDSLLHAASTTLVDAASAVDAGAATGVAGAVLAARVRSVVADAVDAVLLRVAHGAGPGPLTSDERHARRVADLQVYVRQHHAERDQARLGQALLESGTWGW